MAIGIEALLTIVLLNLYLDEVFTSGPNMETYPSYEYAQIFKSIPALFEYLLSAVEENPEILEKNDVNIFKRNTNTQSSDDLSNKYEPYSKEDNYKKKEKQHFLKADPNDYELKNNIIESTTETNTFGYPPSTIAYEYGNSLGMPNSDNDNCKVDIKREINIMQTKTLARDENNECKTKKRQIDENNEFRDISHTDKANEDVDWSSEGDIGFQSLRRLDVQPSEIEQSILLTERLLDDFNTERLKNKVSK